LCFSDFTLVSQSSTRPANAGPLKDQFMHKVRLFAFVATGFAGGFLTLNSQTILLEGFASDPTTRGWEVFGDSTLFQWSETNQNLEVTWNSAQTNSYFHRPLGRTLTRRDDFSFGFDLQLSDIAIGTSPEKPYTFQLAVGFVSLADATATNFLRGTGMDSPNVVEFDYFPDSGFGATVSPTIISSNMQFATSFNSPLELTTSDTFHIALSYTASNQTLVTVMTRNGVEFGPIQDAVLGTNFSDFTVDAFAVSSYSDAGQDPLFAGSILAHGVIDNVVIALPLPPVPTLTGSFVASGWQTEFAARADWSYTLQRSGDFQSWAPVSPVTPGIDGVMSLTDTNAFGPQWFYRVLAERQ